MTTRSNFLISAPRTATAPPTTATHAGYGGSSLILPTVISDANLQAEMFARLTAELDDATTVKTLAPVQFDVGLTPNLPRISEAQVYMIVASTSAILRTPRAASSRRTRRTMRHCPTRARSTKALRTPRSKSVC
ncbi:hypothetical protein [Paraburkholderia fynbosensis]|uniref:hypothetical protein n=1 Tax=Paraburkholderia fynbosensis TaxID=1200993 RepID=UPI0015826CA8|nr:hypothetical protein [Paraburkholderia fynbosensis]